MYKAKQSGFTLFELLFALFFLTMVVGIGYVVLHFLMKFW